MSVFTDRRLYPDEVEMLWREMNVVGAKASTPLQLPPPCFKDMEGEFLRYKSRKVLLTSFPVLDRQLNPLGVMQGGYIAAAFDNTLGPLSFLAAQKPSVTLDMTQTYLRPAGAGETIHYEAEVVTRGLKTLYMVANAYDSRGKHVATAQTQILIL
jgi:uncharacterized protein (TIGR00369 family)